MKKLFEIYKETMLTPKGVLEKAIAKAVPARNTASYTRKNFSKIIDQIGQEAYRVFLVEQEKAGKRAIKKYFDKSIPESSSRDAAIKGVSDKFREFDRFFCRLHSPENHGPAVLLNG